MSRQIWESRKNGKFFYVRIYRWCLNLTFYASMFNILLLGLIWYSHMHQPSRAYYATSGVTPPVQLTPLADPNNSPDPLLPSDPEQVQPPKPIPE